MFPASAALHFGVKSFSAVFFDQSTEAFGIWLRSTHLVFWELAKRVSINQAPTKLNGKPQ